MFSYFLVKERSMEPLCNKGDFVLVNRMSYLLSYPKIGHTILFRYPEDKNLLLIKRITRVKRQKKQLFYWVLGDNALESKDSRVFGWIPRKLILGKAKVIHRTSPLTRSIITQYKEKVGFRYSPK